ncbi:hypothetical protein IP92_05560 [Pseudoduganella flava]|uniref:Lipoprotein n=1 Tax=Pseudoduganella flava TaxID=871742 RepID=A0A562PCN9_9BURK|nr:hypothetical protein [Pseudoduganella flava]QGZ40083.1 hypothetical protein GO485_14120 [Pseudoduganella flava]TWI42168.1 hypothetical protein IP92_05560 [Pseudoduganella flava]
MNRLLIATLVGTLLAGCGSSDDPAPVQPTVTLPELAAGVYAVSSGDEASPAAGKYYVAADGTALAILNDTKEQAQVLYRRAGKDAWQATPAVKQDTAVRFLGTNPLPSAAVDSAGLAGSYAVRLASGATAAFTFSGAGDIAAGGSTCKLSGKASASPLPGTLKLTLNATGCGDLPAAGEGYLVVDADYAPARFRLVTASGATLTDLWAYAE